MTRKLETDSRKVRGLGASPDTEAPKLGRLPVVAEPVGNDHQAVADDNDHAVTKAKQYREIAIDGADTDTGEHDYTARLMSERLPGQPTGGGRGAKRKKRGRKPYVSKKAQIPETERCVSDEKLRISDLTPAEREYWHRRTGEARSVLREFVERQLVGNPDGQLRVKEVFDQVAGPGNRPRRFGAPGGGGRDFVLYGLPLMVIDDLRLYPGLARALLAIRANRAWVHLVDRNDDI